MHQKAKLSVFSKEDQDFEKEALEAGFLIRDCQNYEGLSEGFYRIAVRTKEENERLITWLWKIMIQGTMSNAGKSLLCAGLL